MTAESEKTYLLYLKRAERVYWNPSTPACRATGPGKAQCLLEPDHDGQHHGNGFDEWGPKGSIWWDREDVA